MPEISSGLFARAAEDASFLAGTLSALDRDELAGALGLDAAGSARLFLCRRPRSERFVEDVRAIAAYVGRDPDLVCASLRLAISVAGLRERAQEPMRQAALAAARDAVADGSERQAAAPTSNAMERVLAAVRDTAAKLPQGRRDLTSLLSWHNPLALVVLPRLSLARATDWFAAGGAPIDLGAGDREVRGLLVAWRGTGVIFVDGALPVAERELTVAHEWGHFVFDYELPRSRILATAPELLEVVDGYRPRTLEDRMDAFLAGVPLGLHMHLLERDGAGDAPWEMALREDVATAFAVELLAPWRRVLATVRGAIGDDMEYEQRLAYSTAAIAERFRLPGPVAEQRARAALRSLGRARGFFER